MTKIIGHFNITSSKIITADNITTMRSDLNVLTNNVDVIDYDVKDINNRVNVLNAQMAETREITQHLEMDLKKTKIISYTALAFGIAGTIGSVASIGMQLMPAGISFTQLLGNAGESITNFFRGIWSKVKITGSPNWTRLRILLGNPAVRSISVDLEPIICWCDEEYVQLDNMSFEDERDNPEEAALSIEAAYEICNQFRETLKPVFKKICQKVEEVASDLEFNGEHITEINNKYNALFSKCVIYDELVRDDTIDIINRIEDNNIILEAEDEITTGLIVMQIFVGDRSQWKRRVYIKIEEKIITEYLGVQENKTVIDPVTGESITLKLLARSEEDRANYFPDVILDGNSLVIEVQNEYKVSGVIIEYNSLTRHMTFGVEDLAYTCDIEALDKKINALAETSHKNDSMMASIQDTYTTVDEVNEVLTNYVLKAEVINKYVPTNTFSGYVKSADEKYRRKDDLSVNISKKVMQQLPIANGIYEPEGITLDFGGTSFIPFHEGAHLIGNVPSTDYKFDIIYQTQETEEIHGTIAHKYNIGGSCYLYWEEATGVLYDYFGTYGVIITLAETEVEMEVFDQIALKYEIEELKTTISSLEARLAALENK